MEKYYIGRRDNDREKIYFKKVWDKKGFIEKV